MTITVAKLQKILAKHDPKRVVVLSCDPEGNHFSPLAAVETCAYEADDDSIGLEELTQAAAKLGYTEDDVSSGKPALVLYPMN